MLTMRNWISLNAGNNDRKFRVDMTSIGELNKFFWLLTHPKKWLKFAKKCQIEKKNFKIFKKASGKIWTVHTHCETINSGAAHSWLAN